MRQDVKRIWVDALRSGKYEQGNNALKRGDAFCCLGVLCAVTGATWHRDGRYLRPIAVDGTEMGDIAMLTIEMLRAAGLTERDASHLAEMNDYEGSPFSAIADYIEANL